MKQNYALEERRAVVYKFVGIVPCEMGKSLPTHLEYWYLSAPSCKAVGFEWQGTPFVHPISCFLMSALMLSIGSGTLCHSRDGIYGHAVVCPLLPEL